MGFLFGNENSIKLDNQDIDDHIMGFVDDINTILGNSRNKSNKELKERIQQSFFDFFNVIFKEQDEESKGIYYYAKFEKAAVNEIYRTNQNILKKHKIDIFEFTLEPNIDESIETDSSKSYINKGYASLIANWSNEKFESIVQGIKEHAKDVRKDNEDFDLTDYRNQIKALKDAKSQRPFSRRFKEFFNGTWWRQKKMFDQIDKTLKENFRTELHNERIQREKNDELYREQEKINKDLEKKKVEEANKEYFKKELLDINNKDLDDSVDEYYDDADELEQDYYKAKQQENNERTFE